jgi:predicted acyl esterase
MEVLVEMQLSWFPVIDRNPQKYVANIFEVGENDFIKAEETIFYDSKDPTHIELP